MKFIEKQDTLETHDQSLKCGEELRKPVFVLVVINLSARLSVVYVTKFILQCDKNFYKYKPESLISSKPAITFFLK